MQDWDFGMLADRLYFPIFPQQNPTLAIAIGTKRVILDACRWNDVDHKFLNISPGSTCQKMNKKYEWNNNGHT